MKWTVVMAMAVLVAGCLVAEKVRAEPRTSRQEDAYVACMVGWAAVALTKQGTRKDVDAAQDRAAPHCRHLRLTKQSYEEGEAMGDAIYGLIRVLANGM
jgi:hypothetical protein